MHAGLVSGAGWSFGLATVIIRRFVFEFVLSPRTETAVFQLLLVRNSDVGSKSTSPPQVQASEAVNVGTRIPCCTSSRCATENVTFAPENMRPHQLPSLARHSSAV